MMNTERKTLSPRPPPLCPSHVSRRFRDLSSHRGSEVSLQRAMLNSGVSHLHPGPGEPLGA